MGAAISNDSSTRQNVPTSGAHIPPAVIRFCGLVVRNDHDNAGHALISKSPNTRITGITSDSAMIRKIALANPSRRCLARSTSLGANIPSPPTCSSAAKAPEIGIVSVAAPTTGSARSSMPSRSTPDRRR